jgi:hypothetical protein
MENGKRKFKQKNKEYRMTKDKIKKRSKVNNKERIKKSE